MAHYIDIDKVLENLSTEYIEDPVLNLQEVAELMQANIQLVTYDDTPGELLNFSQNVFDIKDKGEKLKRSIYDLKRAVKRLDRNAGLIFD